LTEDNHRPVHSPFGGDINEGMSQTYAMLKIAHKILYGKHQQGDREGKDIIVDIISASLFLEQKFGRKPIHIEHEDATDAEYG
jgi:hypothetical protein